MMMRIKNIFIKSTWVAVMILINFADSDSNDLKGITNSGRVFFESLEGMQACLHSNNSTQNTTIFLYSKSEKHFDESLMTTT
jgi:hypothetical protein